MKRICWILLSVCLLLGATSAPARAQESVLENAVQRNEARVSFPDEVLFQLEVDPGVSIEKAALTYDVVKFSCLEVGTQVPVAVGGPTIEWTWVMSRSGNPPPGAELWWQWTLTDSAGNTFTTPRQTLTFTDDRFEWRTVEAEGIRLNWYRGDEVGEILLDAAVTGLHRLQNEMGIELQNEAQFFIYGSSEDMRQAVLYIQDWAGGVAFSEYNVILMGVPPAIAESWGRGTVQHELAHLVIGQLGQSCTGGRRPNWLEEGLAVYAEGEPQEDIAADLEQAIASNSFEPIRSLNGPFPAHGPEAGVAYSQSYSVVKFMLDTYGQEKMRDLILLLAEGEGYDEALQQGYGFNIDGLEREWRDSLDLPQRPIPPTPTAITAANIATIVPMGAPQDLPTPPAAAATPPPAAPQDSPGICGIGLVPILLMGLVVMVSIRPKRQKS